MSDFKLVARSAVADPRFPVGETPTTDVGTFQQKCMRKQKNWVPLGWGGDGTHGWRPPSLPMHWTENQKLRWLPQKHFTI